MQIIYEYLALLVSWLSAYDFGRKTWIRISGKMYSDDYSSWPVMTWPQLLLRNGKNLLIKPC